jgi:hypothetical protein
MRGMPSVERDYGEPRLRHRINHESTGHTRANDRHVTASIALERRRDLSDSVAQEPEGVR